MSLKDKVALITGAASGIGKALAEAFAAAGTTVVIADLQAEEARTAAEELNRCGRRTLGIAMDVTSEEQVERGMKQAIDAFGRLDILISNAGIQIVAPLEDRSCSDW